MEKMKRKVANLLITSKNSDSNINNKFTTPKLISFLLFISKVNLNDLGDWNDTKDER